MLNFRWRVPESGYRWNHVRDEDAPSNWPAAAYLVPIQDWPYQEIRLEQHTGLFRAFVDTVPTEEGILKFANRYGNLGAIFDILQQMKEPIDPPGEDRTEDDVAEDQRAFRRVDSFELWRHQIAEMQECVQIWESLKKNQGSEKDARALCDAVNRNLESQVNVSLEQFRQSSGHLLVGRLNTKSRQSRLAIHLTPVSLLGALWLQLAQAVGGHLEHRMCSTCREWFEVSPKVARTNRLYCSEACRSRAYRGRKEQAKSLTAKGKTLGEVATELGSDVKTVKGWISEADR